MMGLLIALYIACGCGAGMVVAMTLDMRRPSIVRDRKAEHFSNAEITAVAFAAGLFWVVTLLLWFVRGYSSLYRRWRPQREDKPDIPRAETRKRRC